MIYMHCLQCLYANVVHMLVFRVVAAFGLDIEIARMWLKVIINVHFIVISSINIAIGRTSFALNLFYCANISVVDLY